jgi:hypothetical protein
MPPHGLARSANDLESQEGKATLAIAASRLADLPVMFSWLLPQTADSPSEIANPSTTNGPVNTPSTL